MVANQEKPVSTPRNITGHTPHSGDGQFDCRLISITGDIFYADFCFVMHVNHDLANRRFDTMLAKLNATHVQQ